MKGSATPASLVAPAVLFSSEHLKTKIQKRGRTYFKNSKNEGKSSIIISTRCNTSFTSHEPIRNLEGGGGSRINKNNRNTRSLHVY